MKVILNIEDYLSHEEIKNIIKETVQQYVYDVIGTGISDPLTKERMFISKLAKELAKEGCQNNIPNYEQTINEHLKEQIKSIKLEDLFWKSFGWRSDGNKIINTILEKNASLIEAKVKEIFKLSLDKK